MRLPSSSTSEASARPDVIQAVAPRHPGRWAAIALIAVLAAMLINSLANNPNWQWGLQFEHAFSEPVLQGVTTTLWLTIAAMVIGVVLGFGLAVMRLSPNPILSGAAWFYVWVFRGTPVLVQLLIWGGLSSLYEQVSLGVPFGPELLSVEVTTLIPPVSAALLGLALNEAAYMSGIIRSGILSVDEGQSEAATALGMSRLLALRRVILPQAMQVVVPPTGNQTIAMLKTTSLVAFIPYYDLFFRTSEIGSRTSQPFPMLVTASLWYLALTSALMVAQHYIERYYSRGSVSDPPRSPLQRLRVRLREVEPS